MTDQQPKDNNNEHLQTVNQRIDRLSKLEGKQKRTKRHLTQRAYPDIDAILHSVVVKANDQLQLLYLKEELSQNDVGKMKLLTELVLLARKNGKPIAHSKADAKDQDTTPDLALTDSGDVLG